MNENPEEITAETNSYTVDWDLTKSDISADIKSDCGHQRRSFGSCKVGSKQVPGRNEPDPWLWKKR